MKKYIEQLLPEITEIRHKIHTFPELGYQEKRTAMLVVDTLKKFGYEVTTGIGGTGVSALLESSKPGKTVALRADMDALPIQEKTQLPYRSQVDGIMHACGHDGHTATLLAVAGALRECTSQFNGRIKFIFQPAEEGGAGAEAMINDGILENPKVDAIFGYHNSPGKPLGSVFAKSDCMMASSDAFKLTIKGRGGHAAHPDRCIDPIYISSLLVQAIQGIVSRFTSPFEPVVVSITQFHAGTTHNVIPDEAILSGTIRTVDKTSQQRVKKQLDEIVQGITGTFGATGVIEFLHSFPPTVNHLNETELLLSTARKIVGDENVIRMPHPTMAAEDFSFYLEKIPGCFFFVGNGVEQKTLHTATYDFNDAIIPIAAEIMGNIAIDYLNKT